MTSGVAGFEGKVGCEELFEFVFVKPNAVVGNCKSIIIKIHYHSNIRLIAIFSSSSPF
ncbi:hypothetical protein D3C80_2225350 [compost metagenome]